MHRTDVLCVPEQPCFRSRNGSSLLLTSIRHSCGEELWTQPWQSGSLVEEGINGLPRRRSCWAKPIFPVISQHANLHLDIRKTPVRKRSDPERPIISWSTLPTSLAIRLLGSPQANEGFHHTPQLVNGIWTKMNEYTRVRKPWAQRHDEIQARTDLVVHRGSPGNNGQLLNEGHTYDGGVLIIHGEYVTLGDGGMMDVVYRSCKCLARPGSLVDTTSFKRSMMARAVGWIFKWGFFFFCFD